MDNTPQEIIDPNTDALMRLLAKVITAALPGLGYMLFVFEFGKAGTSNYVSNADRKDAIQAMRETADRLEKRQDIQPYQQN